MLNPSFYLFSLPIVYGSYNTWLGHPVGVDSNTYISTSFMAQRISNGTISFPKRFMNFTVRGYHMVAILVFKPCSVIILMSRSLLACAIIFLISPVMFLYSSHSSLELNGVIIIASSVSVPAATCCVTQRLQLSVLSFVPNKYVCKSEWNILQIMLDFTVLPHSPTSKLLLAYLFLPPFRIHNLIFVIFYFCTIAITTECQIIKLQYYSNDSIYI